MSITLEQATDHICEQINLRDRNQLGVDVILYNAGHLERPLFDSFMAIGEKLTVGGVFEDMFVFCWAETPDHHAAWMSAH